MHETVARLYNLAGAIAILMVPLLCFCVMMAYLEHRKTKVNDLYIAIKADINDEKWAKDLRVQEVDNVLFYVDCGMDFEEAYNEGRLTTPNKYT